MYIISSNLKFVIILKNVLCPFFLTIICLTDDQEVLKAAEKQFFKEMDNKQKGKNDGKKTS